MVDLTEPRLIAIAGVVNDPSITWKVKRALLSHSRLSQEAIEELVPAESCPPHSWDDERCRKCGTKDWMTG